MGRTLEAAPHTAPVRPPCPGWGTPDPGHWGRRTREVPWGRARLCSRSRDHAAEEDKSLTPGGRGLRFPICTGKGCGGVRWSEARPILWPSQRQAGGSGRGVTCLRAVPPGGRVARDACPGLGLSAERCGGARGPRVVLQPLSHPPGDRCRWPAATHSFIRSFNQSSLIYSLIRSHPLTCHSEVLSPVTALGDLPSSGSGAQGSDCC